MKLNFNQLAMAFDGDILDPLLASAAPDCLARSVGVSREPFRGEPPRDDCCEPEDEPWLGEAK